MPTYEYNCPTCNRNFDVVQSFEDDPLTVCPTCGSPVRKVFGSVGIVFKGSGFYKTDSRSGNGASGTNSVPRTSDGPSTGGGTADTSSPSAASDNPSSGSKAGPPAPPPTAASSTTAAAGA